MKVKKISLNLKKIIIDIILCPKINLYLQSPVCYRCAYFISDEKNHINCNYKKPQIRNTNQKKEELIKLFSKIKGEKEISPKQIVDKKRNHDSIRNIETLKADLIKELKKRKNSMMI